MTSLHSQDGSLIRPLINTILWAFSISNTKRREQALLSCKEYMDSFNLVEEYQNLYQSLSQSSELPIMQIRQALKKDSLVELVSQATVKQFVKPIESPRSIKAPKATEAPESTETAQTTAESLTKEVPEAESLTEQPTEPVVETNSSVEAPELEVSNKEKSVLNEKEERSDAPEQPTVPEEVGEPVSVQPSKPNWDNSIRKRILSQRSKTRDSNPPPEVLRRYDFWSRKDTRRTV